MKNKKSVKNKKSKKKSSFKLKKEFIGGTIVVGLLILVLVTYVMCYDYKSNSGGSLNIIDRSLSYINIYDDYTTDKVVDKDSVISDKSILGSYNCKNDDCEVYASNFFDSIYNDKYIFIKENKKIFVYDYLTKKIVSKFYDDISIKLDNNNYIVKNEDKYGIMNDNALEITKPIYDEILYDSSLVDKAKVLKDNLYGVLDVSNGLVIIEPNYSNINMDSASYYSVLINDLWYVIDSENNILTDGYAYTFAFNKGFIGLKDSNLYIFNYNEIDNGILNDTSIPVSLDGNENFYVERDNNIIYINENNSGVKYEYDIKRNILKKN